MLQDPLKLWSSWGLWWATGLRVLPYQFCRFPLLSILSLNRNIRYQAHLPIDAPVAWLERKEVRDLRRQHRGHRSLYGEEKQLVQYCAFFDHENKDRVNVLGELKFFPQGIVLSDTRGEGVLQKRWQFLQLCRHDFASVEWPSGPGGRKVRRI